VGTLARTMGNVVSVATDLDSAPSTKAAKKVDSDDASPADGRCARSWSNTCGLTHHCDRAQLTTHLPRKQLWAKQCCCCCTHGDDESASCDERKWSWLTAAGGTPLGADVEQRAPCSGWLG
jgi:hypothetical protein